jgi:hypothetical protein
MYLSRVMTIVIFLKSSITLAHSVDLNSHKSDNPYAKPEEQEIPGIYVQNDLSCIKS